MARNVRFSFLRGGGSSLEVLYGKVSLTPTNLHTLSTTAVLPAPTTFDLINGVAVATNVAPTPEPVDGAVAWAYKVKVTDTYGKSWEFLVGVPDGTTEINFNVLPRYTETRPPAYGVGPAGPAGQSATIAIGTTTTGETPAVVNSGTSTNAVLDFTLVRGEVGATGPQGPEGPVGPQGPKGDKGADGTSVTIKGKVPTAANLPLTGNQTGDGWITDDDRHLHIWAGTSFTDVGTVAGPKGDKGADGLVVTSPKEPTAPPSDYTAGRTEVFQTSNAAWPTGATSGGVTIETLIVSAGGRGYQTAWAANSGRVWIRTPLVGGVNGWSPFKEMASTDIATQLMNGLMSAMDKAKLDAATAIATDGTVVLRGAGGETNIKGIYLTSGPTSASHATRKDYVDQQVATRALTTHVHPDVSDSASGFMTPGDKAKLDGVTLAYRSKTGSAPPSSYPVGFSTGTQNTGDGWPGPASNNVQVVSFVSPLNDRAASQWVYTQESTAPVFRTSNGAVPAVWGAWQTVATDSSVDGKLAGVVRVITTDQNYYVSTTGSDANNGLSSGSAFRTINKAVAQTQRKTYATGIKTYINLAAGNYGESVRFDDLNTTRRIIHIKGPTRGHPLVPTASIQLAVGNTSTGLVMRDPNLELIIEDVKFKGFNGNSSAAGIAATGGGVLRTINVHAELCFWGITCSRSVLDVTGGIFTNNGRTEGSSSAGAAIRSLMLNNHSIGTQYGSLAQGPIFRQNYYGILAQESSVGHVDYCTFEDNDYGLLARVNSRANAGGSIFNRNLIAIQATGNSYILFSEGAFGTGANNNNTNTEARSGGVLTMSTLNAYLEGIDNSSSAGLRRVSATYTPITHNTGTAYVFEHNMTQGWWDDSLKSTRPPKKLTLRISGNIVGSTASKSISVRLGVTADNANVVFNTTAGENGDFELEVQLVTITATTQYFRGTLLINGATPKVSQDSTTVNMSTVKQLRLAASAAGSGDSIVFRAIETYIEG